MATTPKPAMIGSLTTDARDAAWLACFSAALTGALAADSERLGAHHPDTIENCMRLADEAVAAIDKRYVPRSSYGVL